MNWQFILYLTPLLFGSCISLGVGFLAWHRRAAPSATPLALLMLATAWWGVCDVIGLLAGPNLTTHIDWYRLRLFGVVSVAPLLLNFVLQYTGKEEWLSHRVLLAVWLPSVVFLVLALTNNVHGLYWQGFDLYQSGPFTTLVIKRGVLNWIFNVFTYLQIILATILFLRWRSKSFSPLERLQAALLTLSLLAPWVFNAFFLIGLSRFDLTSLAFSLTGLALAWVLYRYSLFQIKPMARDQLIEQMDEGMILLDARGHIVDINPAAARMIGVSALETVGKPVLDVFSSWPHLVEPFSNVHVTQAEIALHEDAKALHCEIQLSPLNDRQGHDVGRLILMRDITARKQAEENLCKMDARYQALVEKIPAVVYTDDYRSGETFYISPFVETILGYSPQDWFQNPRLCDDILHPEDRERVLHEIRNAQATGHFVLEYRYIAKDGHIVWIHDEASLLKDELGEPTYWQGFLLDVTERKRAEEKLLRSASNMAILSQVSQQLLTVAETEQIFTLSHAAAQKLMPLDSFVIAILDELKQKIEYVYLWDEDKRWPAERSPLRQGLADYIIRSGESLRVNNWNELHTRMTDSRLFGNMNKDTESVLAIPLLDRSGRCFGMISAQAYASDVYTDEHEILLIALASQSAKAIENMHLLKELQQELEVRKQAEAAVHESEERFRLIAWATTDAVWDWDLYTDQIWWGVGLQKIFHYAVGTIPADSQWRQSHIHPEDRLKVAAAINQVLNSDMEFWSKEYRFLCADGSYAYVMDRAYIMRDLTGKPYRMIGAMMDITRRKEMEEELRNSEETYRTIFETVEDVIYETDYHGVLTTISPSIERYLGLRPEDLIGRPIRELFANPHDYETLDATFTAQGFIKDYEILFLDKAGQELIASFNAHTTFNEAGVPIGVRGIARDITRRKQMEYRLAHFNAELEQLVRERTTQLQSANAFLASLVTTALMINSTLDQDIVLDQILRQARLLVPCRAINIMLIQDGMAHIARRIGYEGLEEIERDLPDYQFPLSWPSFEKMIKTGRSVLIADTVKDPDWQHPQSSKWTRSYIGMPLKVDGETIGFLNASHDLPDFFDDQNLVVLEGLAQQAAIAIRNANMHQELGTLLHHEKMMRTQLVQVDKLAVLGKMVAVIAHEINNPIQTVKNSLFLLKDQVETQGPFRDAFDFAQAEVNRIAELVAQLRDTYQPTQLKTFTHIDLVELLADTKLILNPQLKNNHVDWVQCEPSDAYIVFGNRNNLKQVFLNLCLNAIESMQPHGRGQIILELRHSLDNRQVGVAIHNSGSLIPAEELEHIFEPFFTTKGSGSGLGLSISQDIIRQHYGEIEVKSDPEKGVTFIVWLPRELVRKA